MFETILGIVGPVVDFYDAIFELEEYYVSIMSFEDTKFVNKLNKIRNNYSTILNDLRKENTLES